MTTLEEQINIIQRAAQIIDDAIPTFSGRTLVDTSEVIDVLLDVRLKLTEVTVN